MSKRIYIYKDVIDALLKAGQDYIDGNIDAITLQRIIRSAEGKIEAVEENDIRDFLINAEGEIENALYMIPSGQRHDVISGIASNLIRRFGIN